MAMQAASARLADVVLKDLEKKLSARSLRDFPSKAKALAEISKTRQTLAAVEKELTSALKAELP